MTIIICLYESTFKLYIELLRINKLKLLKGGGERWAKPVVKPLLITGRYIANNSFTIATLPLD